MALDAERAARTFEEICREPWLRRCWLLLEALNTLPLHQAIGVAARAEMFLLGGPAAAALQPEEGGALETGAAASAMLAAGDALPEPAAPEGEEGPQETALAAERRTQMLARITDGASDAELVAEFGLSPRQAQDFRTQMVQLRSAVVSATEEDVVRYLRQQGDIVIGAGEGQFLVNARFKLSFEELLDRANRMRYRQNKELFVAKPGTAKTPGAVMQLSKGVAGLVATLTGMACAGHQFAEFSGFDFSGLVTWVS